jgi:hypothetical protein
LSEIRATTISDAAGTGPITLTGQAAVRAYISFDNATTATIEESLNIASITDQAAGETQVNLSNNMSSSEYCIVASAGRTTSGGSPAAQWMYEPTASKWQHETMANGGSYIDADNNYSAAFGDLA